MWRRHHPYVPDDEMLQQVRLFALLPPTARARLLPDARYIVYPKGEEVDVEPDEQGAQLLAVVEGSVRLAFRSAEGREMVVHTVEASDVFVLGEGGWAGADETVVTACWQTVICSVPLEICEDVIDTCRASQRTLRTAERRLARALGATASGLLHGPEERIKHRIYWDIESSADASVACTHEELAARTCTDRARVTRVLGDLRRDGIIELEPRAHRIIVRDRTRLLDGE